MQNPTEFHSLGRSVRNPRSANKQSALVLIEMSTIDNIPLKHKDSFCPSVVWSILFLHFSSNNIIS